MENNINQDLYADSLQLALKVDFIASSEELRLYATAIYNALMWSKKVDRRNNKIQKRNRLLK